METDTIDKENINIENKEKPTSDVSANISASNTDVEWIYELAAKKWVLYDDDITRKLNRTGEDEIVEFELEKTKLCINLEIMKQVNMVTGFRRNVRCQTKGDDGSSFIWEFMSGRRYAGLSKTVSIALESAMSSSATTEVKVQGETYTFDPEVMLLTKDDKSIKLRRKESNAESANAALPVRTASRTRELTKRSAQSVDVKKEVKVEPIEDEPSPPKKSRGKKAAKDEKNVAKTSKASVTRARTPSATRSTITTNREKIKELSDTNVTLNQELTKLKQENSGLKEQILGLTREKIDLHSQLTLATETCTAQRIDIERYLLRQREAESMIEELNRVRREDAFAFQERERDLVNNVVDLRGQIRVALRVRGATKNDGNLTPMEFPNSGAIKIENGKSIEFQRVFDPFTTQRDVFDECKELFLSVLNGYNVAVIAYGQTGSGKTFTMRGGDSAEDEGIIPRAMRYLLEEKDKRADYGWQTEFTVSFLEVYQEEIYDLMTTDRKKLKVENNTVSHLTNVAIQSFDDMIPVLRQADAARTTAATRCNEHSSRSHTIFQLTMTAVNEEKGRRTHAVLKLIDLAGSDRAKEAGNQAGDCRFNEMKSINHGLSQLQLCIRSLLQKKSHVPYRDSKLTQILCDCLGGNSKTMVIVALNPNITQVNETKRSIDFCQKFLAHKASEHT